MNTAAIAQLRAKYEADIADLRAQLEAVGAGGVSGRLMGGGVSVLSREALLELIDSHSTAAYCCNRVWEAWNVGTMSQDDFQPITETDFANDLTNSILAMPSAAPVPPTAQPAEPAVSDALADSQYIAGAKAGFSAAQSSDPDALNKLIATRDGYLKVFAEARATQQSAPAAQPAMPEFEVVAWLTDDGRVATNRTKTEAMHRTAQESFSDPLIRKSDVAAAWPTGGTTP